jgi:hypothetical protein
VGFCECLVLKLQFLEQPHVLNGDDRLVGEGLDERGLLVGERLDLAAVDCDRADETPILDQRHP